MAGAAAYPEISDPGGVPGDILGATLKELEALLGNRLATSRSEREHHSHDESHHRGRLPDAVAWCASTGEVAAVLALCSRNGVPVVPFGTGTGLEGGVVACRGGVSLDLSRMNRILRVSNADLDATVEAGVTRGELNEHLRRSGLFFPVDPGADASLAGMAATRASGTNAVRYGTMRENVLGLTVVLADGRVLRTGGRVRKSAAGYDLTRLFVGSEGTLGVITEVTVRLFGLPEHEVAAVCGFARIRGAVDAVIRIVQSGILVARVELLDDVMIDAVNRYSGLDHVAQPTLFFEFHGAPGAVGEQVEEVEAIVGELGGSPLRWVERRQDRTAMWKARHDALPAAKALRPGSRTWSTDVCVPISRLADCITETKEDIEAAGLLAPIAGHVGDGNFHLAFVLDVDDADEMARAGALHERLVARALAMEGTCTGEHGIGLGKQDFLRDEHGLGVDVMRQIKDALDPAGIMNPGKVLGPDPPPARDDRRGEPPVSLA